MPVLISPPRLLDSGGSPANGTFTARVTGQFGSGADVVLPVRSRGWVVDGVFAKTPAGGEYELPPTPPGVAVEIVLALTEWRSGRKTPAYSTRTVTVPDTATVTWETLTDSVPVAAPPGVVYEDPENPNLYYMTSGFTADSANPGLYIIGA